MGLHTSKTTTISQELSSKIRDQLMSYPQVTDVGLGIQMKNGRYTQQVVITVFVKKKLPLSELDSHDILPKEIEGIPVDVQQELDPQFFQLQDGDELDLTRLRPLESGLAISVESSSNAGGTLGFFARRNSDQKPVLVSNYHVLFRDLGIAISDEFPNRVYQFEEAVENLIGKVPDADAGAIGGSVDCAYAVLEEESCCCFSRHIIGHENKVEENVFVGIAAAEIGMKVFKKGARTGKTVGKVINVTKSIDQPVDYSDYFLPAGNSFTFSNLIMIATWDDVAGDYVADQKFSDTGDSGSAIYNENNEIVGLHLLGYANSDESVFLSLACRIEEVENELGITVPGTRNLNPPPPPPTPPEVAILDVPVNPTEGDIALAGALTEITGQSAWEILKPQMNATKLGKAFLDSFEYHAFEIMRLVNHNREVTLAWQRGKGPAFLAALVRGSKYPDYQIPQYMEGVSIAQTMEKMRNAFHAHGGNSLDQFAQHYLPILTELLDTLPESFSMDQLMTQVAAYSHHLPNMTPNAG